MQEKHVAASEEAALLVALLCDYQMTLTKFSDEAKCYKAHLDQVHTFLHTSFCSMRGFRLHFSF